VSQATGGRAVVVDAAGPTAPPRQNGELVFDAPWQGRAFGLCMAVLEREGLEWADFRAHLVTAIARLPEAGYYEHFVAALADLLVERGLVERGLVDPP
jgi:nitrile hydratase accessory protein